MAEVFGNYPENTGTVSESVDDIKIIRKDIKKLIKCIGKLCKEERRKRKLLQKEHNRLEMEERSGKDVKNGQEICTDKNGEDCNVTKSRQKGEKSFLNRISEAFLKALPSIFRTVTSVAVTLVFGFFSKRFGVQGRAAYATG